MLERWEFSGQRQRWAGPALQGCGTSSELCPASSDIDGAVRELIGASLLIHLALPGQSSRFDFPLAGPYVLAAWEA